AIVLELDEHAAELGHLAPLDQPVAQLARLHRRRRVERAPQRAVILDQLRRGLRPDAVDARDVVDAVAHQREHVAHLFRRHAELLDHLGDADALVLHRVEHVDAAALDPVVGLGALADELHQVLVARDDRHVPPAPRRLPGIGGDQVVGLEVVLLDARQAERARRVADQRELRNEVLRRRRPVGLVLVVERVAEAGRTLVEDHREMCRTVRLVELVGQLPQHRRVAVDRADRHAVRVGQRRQPVIRAEDVGRTVDQVEMLLFGHRCLLAALCAEVSRFDAPSRPAWGCFATKLPLFPWAEFTAWWVSRLLSPDQPVRRASVSAVEGLTNMRKIVLVAAIAGAALSLAACSQETQEAAEDTAEGAMADAETNAEAVGDAMSDAAGDAAAPAEDAANEAEAEVQGETETEAAAD